MRRERICLEGLYSFWMNLFRFLNSSCQSCIFWIKREKEDLKTFPKPFWWPFWENSISIPFESCWYFTGNHFKRIHGNKIGYSIWKTESFFPQKEILYCLLDKFSIVHFGGESFDSSVELHHKNQDPHR